MSEKISMSVVVDQFDRILIFNNEQDFKEAVEGHEHVTPLVGERPSDREQFPQVFIAGWK